ncbi:MAG: hypothetical protein LBS40_05795 [Burkholderiales bacterium]|jgi:hypothetical protein|nr:hypothetical protein [Burkholderiales bacterium]
MKTRDDRIAAFINRCTEIMEKIEPTPDGKWKLVLPEPSDEAEEEALCLFIQVVTEEIGMPPVSGGVN